MRVKGSTSDYVTVSFNGSNQVSDDFPILFDGLCFLYDRYMACSFKGKVVLSAIIMYNVKIYIRTEMPSQAKCKVMNNRWYVLKALMNMALHFAYGITEI